MLAGAGIAGGAVVTIVIVGGSVLFTLLITVVSLAIPAFIIYRLIKACPQTKKRLQTGAILSRYNRLTSAPLRRPRQPPSPCPHGENPRDLQPEGWGRQDHHHDQPQRSPRRGRSARAGRRPRSAGKRELRPRLSAVG